MKYPIGIQNFESLRMDGYVYVDKTALIYKLVNEGRYYFLSRPRRFGKSLLISTLEAYLSGKRELFKGLAIEQLEKDWREFPVLHMDLNSRNYINEEDFIRGAARNTLTLGMTPSGSKYRDRAIEERFYHIVRCWPMRKRESVVSFLLTNMTSRCCRLSTMRNFRTNTVPH
jgi:hypothetical protein